jgi:hypothetical protein
MHKTWVSETFRSAIAPERQQQHDPYSSFAAGTATLKALYAHAS